MVGRECLQQLAIVEKKITFKAKELFISDVFLYFRSELEYDDGEFISSVTNNGVVAMRLYNL